MARSPIGTRAWTSPAWASAQGKTKGRSVAKSPKAVVARPLNEPWRQQGPNATSARHACRAPLIGAAAFAEVARSKRSESMKRTLRLAMSIAVAAGAAPPSRRRTPPRASTSSTAAAPATPSAPARATRPGPQLNGIVGRKAASAAGFNYSDAMKRGRGQRARLDGGQPRRLPRIARYVPAERRDGLRGRQGRGPSSRTSLLSSRPRSRGRPRAAAARRRRPSQRARTMTSR